MGGSGQGCALASRCSMVRLRQDLIPVISSYLFKFTLTLIFEIFLLVHANHEQFKHYCCVTRKVWGAQVRGALQMLAPNLITSLRTVSLPHSRHIFSSPCKIVTYTMIHTHTNTQTRKQTNNHTRTHRGKHKKLSKRYGAEERSMCVQ